MPRASKENAIREYVLLCNHTEGRMPTYAEIALATGATSRSTIARHLKHLRAEGIIEGAEDASAWSKDARRICLKTEEGGRVFMDLAIRDGKPEFSGILDTTLLNRTISCITGFTVVEA